MNESKSEKFKRLAELRVNNALKSIQLIGNLSNKSVYQYDPSDARKIIRVLKNSITKLEKDFTSSSKSNFKL